MAGTANPPDTPPHTDHDFVAPIADGCSFSNPPFAQVIGQPPLAMTGASPKPDLGKGDSTTPLKGKLSPLGR